MVIETSPSFPVLTAQSPLLLVSQTPEDPEGLIRNAGTAAFVAALWEQPETQEQLTSLAERLGPRLLLPEQWGQVLPQCGVLISSSVSGGSLSQRLKEAAQAAPRRCWLMLEWLAMDFTIPCPSGTGTALQREQLSTLLDAYPSFFDEDLSCQYLHFADGNTFHMVLYDTADTLARKAALAREAGFAGAVIPGSSAL